MAAGDGEQSSCDDCREECRRQTTSPPGPEITLRSMTSRSTVTQPAGRDGDGALSAAGHHRHTGMALSPLR